jgi:hypothetical protein
MPIVMERAILHSSGLVEAFEKTGASWPERIDPDNCFAVLCLRWDRKDRDFTFREGRPGSIKIFDDFHRAIDRFNEYAYGDFVDAPEREIKLELVQYDLGIGKVIRSTILFP